MPPTEGMVFLDGGRFAMGSDRHYPEERPARDVLVNGFWIDQFPVTNRDFARFVEATGHVTFAEIAPDPRDYPGLTAELAVAGSTVFLPPDSSAALTGENSWWDFVHGAQWRHPLGPRSGIDEILDHPVVQIAYGDALAFARWVGKDLPTEAEWEFAARGGLEGADYAWGDELAPGGAMMANYWQGPFPHGNTLADGWERTSPVGSYPANAYGLSDMIGNVWEWTRDWWSVAAPADLSPRRQCCAIENPRGGTLRGSLDRADPLAKAGRRVMKGGSHLCAKSYCQRYRPAARHPQAVDSPTSHIGFRCVLREASPVP